MNIGRYVLRQPSKLGQWLVMLHVTERWYLISSLKENLRKEYILIFKDCEYFYLEWTARWLGSKKCHKCPQLGSSKFVESKILP